MRRGPLLKFPVPQTMSSMAGETTPRPQMCPPWKGMHSEVAWRLNFESGNQSDVFPVSLQVMWTEESAAEGTWRMDISLAGVWNTPELCPACWVPCLLSEEHRAPWHENLNTTMSLGCAGISLRSYWQLVRAGVKDAPSQSKVFPAFSVFGKTMVYILLMHRDAFTHLYTIKCWGWCCFPRRILGFLPSWLEVSHAGLLLFNKSILTVLDVFVFTSNITGKVAIKNKNKSSCSSSLYPPDAVASLVSGEKTCVLEKEHGLLSHVWLCSNHWIIIWKTDVVTLLNRTCLYLYLMKCLSELVNW